MKFELQPCMEFPQKHKTPDWDTLPISPDGSKISISTGPTELTILDSARGLIADAKLNVPFETRRVAAHPGHGPIAVVTDRQLQLLDPAGTTISLLDLDPTWGDPRAISYDKSGRLLCLSTEVAEDDENDGNLLFVLDARTLACLSQVSLEGENDSGHYMVWHPTQDVVAIDVACGQDGTWLNLVQVAPTESKRLPAAPDSFDSFGPATFLSEGKAIALVGSTWVQLWSFPDCKLLKKMELPEEEYTGYVGSTHEGLLLVPIESAKERHSQLLILDQDLQEQARLDFPLAPLSSNAFPGGIIVSTMATHTKVSRVVLKES